MNPAGDPGANTPGAAGQPGSEFLSDFWSGVNQYASTPQPQQEQPFGIDWDHPVFSDTHQQHTQHAQHMEPQVQQTQPQSVQPLQTQFSTSGDLFAQPQPAWQQQTTVPRQESQQNYQVSQVPQYRVAQLQPAPSQQRAQFQHQPQQTASPYHQYHFDQNYFANSQVPGQGGFLHHQQTPPPPRPEAPVNQNQTVTPTSLDNTVGPTYGLAGSQFTNTSVGYPGGFQDPHARQYHQTINPQFLTAPQHRMQSPGQQQGVYGINPANLETRTFTQYPSLAPNPPSIQPQYLMQQGQLQPIAAKSFVNGVTPVNQVEKQTLPAQRPTKVKKQTTKAKSKAIKEESSSESDYSDSSDNEEPEPSPLPAVRPSDIEGGTKYDALKIVWSPRNKHPSADSIRKSMVAFGELVKRIRDTWKSHSEALKKAENQNEEQKVPTLKTQVLFQRHILDAVVKTAIDSGHPAFVHRYGEHPHIVSSLYSFLLDRFNAADYNGPSTIGILKLMTKFTSMDQEMLEKTKNDKILTRFAKKGDETVKQLVQTVLENAAASTKRKKEKPPTPASKTPSKESSPTVERKPLPEVEVVVHDPPKPPTTPVDQTIAAKLPQGSTQYPVANQPKPLVQATTKTLPAVGSKRPRENESKEQPAIKKAATSANGKPVALKPGTTTTVRKVTPVAQNGKPGQTQPGTAPKQKINMVTPKSQSLFSSLSSASKKPGTSNAARAAAAAAAASKEKANADQKPPAPRHVAPAFSFSQTMADLSKPKEVTPTKPAEELPPENEEERKKRLRKEERRKLRVRWKPDDSLVQVKLFTHDPEEEIGHDSSMIRDVDDVAGEGRMLKLHRGFEDLDDDDDEGLIPYTMPTVIDFEELGEERDKIYIKAGGKKVPDSKQKREQDEREANTLGVFYTSSLEVPESPKEPPADALKEPFVAEVPFGDPDDRTKARSERYFAARAPKQPPAPAQQAPTPPAGNLDISALLKIIQSSQQQSQQPVQPPTSAPPVPQNNMGDLEKTFNHFRNPIPLQPSVPTPPPVSQPAAPAIDLQRILAMINPQAQMQGQQQTPGFPPPPIPPPSTQAGSNLASLLSQLPNASGQQPNQQSQFQPNNQSYGGYGGKGNHHHGRPRGEDWGRKRNYDGPAFDEGSYPKRFRGNGDGHKTKKHPKAGMVPCRYWKEGKCLKGDDCTFRHNTA